MHPYVHTYMPIEINAYHLWGKKESEGIGMSEKSYILVFNETAFH